tara:strand:- start:3871 stop:4212 length:342 start_codon:yes stop_codon:yes gene_type:complete
LFVILKTSTSGGPHVGRWGQVNGAALVIILAGLPGVTVLAACDVVVPAFTISAALRVQLVLVEEDTVAASATFRDVVGSGWSIVVRQSASVVEGPELVSLVGPARHYSTPSLY